MTVYVTADELVDIEHARLKLRRDHGLAVDRGRLVREALAIVLADLDAARRRQRARPPVARMTATTAELDRAGRTRHRGADAASPSGWTTSRARSTCC